MDKSDITLERMRTFVRVAERGNLSAVAREFGTGQSTVTRHLRELEAALGAALLSRTTRRVALTDEGAGFYARCLDILRQVDEASADVRDTGAAAAGTVRISATAALGVRHITRLILAFQALHPDVRVDLGLTDERVDLVKEGVDIAVRLGPLADSALKQRRIGDSARLLVAAPTYLAARGRPERPEALASHEVVRMANIAGSDVITLTAPDGRAHTVTVGGRLRVDHGLAAREAFLAGHGLGPAHHWLADDLLANGALEPLLAGYALPSVPLSLLIVPERAGLKRVRLLIDYLAERLARLPGITPTSGRPSASPAAAT